MASIEDAIEPWMGGALWFVPRELGCGFFQTLLRVGEAPWHARA